MCRMESASRQPSVISPEEKIMGGTALKIWFKKPLAVDQPRLYLAKVLTAINQSRRPIFLPSARLRGK